MPPIPPIPPPAGIGGSSFGISATMASVVIIRDAHRVFNSSITGDTTQGGLARLPRLLEKYRPGVVIPELDGNDGLRGLPIEVTRGNLSSMIGQSPPAGASVILAEMRIPPNDGRTYTESIGRIKHWLLVPSKYCWEFQIGHVVC
jgi:hypothetical protein